MRGENKKGALGILLVILGIAFLLVFGVLMALGSATINWVMDTTVPELEGIGQVGSWNSTETVDIAVTPVNNFVQSFTWLSGVIYVLGILGLFGLAFAYRNTNERWMVGLFLLLMLIIMIASIFISNIYEDFYTGNDEIATILQEHQILSFLILYSPGIFAIIGFLAGIILFSSNSGGVA